MIGAPCARRFSCTDTLHTSVARMLCVRLSLRHTSSAPDFVSVHPRCSKRFDRAPGQSHGSNTFCASVLKSQTARSRSNASSVSFFMHAQYRECSDSYENSRSRPTGSIRTLSFHAPRRFFRFRTSANISVGVLYPRHFSILRFSLSSSFCMNSFE